MDQEPDSVALLSIKPEYVDAIFKGEKRVEFRRTRFARNVSHIIVYATQPVGAVVGYFEVGLIEENTPDRLWDSFGTVGCIDKDKFDQYFDGTSIGYAIGVKNPVRLSENASLNRYSGLSRPPQSFAYLGGREKARFAKAV